MKSIKIKMFDIEAKNKQNSIKLHLNLIHNTKIYSKLLKY